MAEFKHVVVDGEGTPGFQRVVVVNPSPTPVSEGGTGGSTGREALRLLSGVYVLAQSAVAVPITGTTVETVAATIVIPANAMGANGRVRVTTLWGLTNNANQKTVRVRLGGAAGTLLQSVGTASNANYRSQVEFANRNDTNSQVSNPTGLGGGGWNTTTGALATPTIDTTVDVDLVLSGLLADAGDTMTLHSYLVELFAGQGT